MNLRPELGVPGLIPSLRIYFLSWNTLIAFESRWSNLCELDQRPILTSFPVHLPSSLLQNPQFHKISIEILKAPVNQHENPYFSVHLVDIYHLGQLHCEMYSLQNKTVSHYRPAIVDTVENVVVFLLLVVVVVKP